MKIIFITIAFVSSLNSFTIAQDTSLYERHLFVPGNTLPYRLLLPLNYDPKKKYPLILFLHGAGERGNDNTAQLAHGADFFLTANFRNNFPAIVVFPQCSRDSYWSNVSITTDSISNKRTFTFKPDGEPTAAMKLLLPFVKDLQKKYRLSKKRLYVGGLSMGGMGSYEIARRLPKKFAAAIAICGGADSSTAKEIKNCAWWIFHGLMDSVVDPRFSENMTSALKNAGADVRLTLYADDGHNSWDDAFKEPGLMTWLFSHHK